MLPTQSKIKTAAEFYLEKGYNVIPFDFKKAVLENVKITKQVVFPFDYGTYHKEKVTSDLINEWWGKHNAIAIITGEISGITVLDVDTKNLSEAKDLPKTFTVETYKGYHFYFKYTDKVITNANLFKKGNVSFNLDTRNNGGIVYAAPSEYELVDGKIAPYKIINNAPLADFPLQWLENIYTSYGRQPGEKDWSPKKSDWKNKLISPLVEGSRNNDFASVLGGLLAKFPQDEWENIVWSLAKDKNVLQKSPLSEGELRTIFNSIAQKELKKRNTGGEIKDVLAEIVEDDIRIDISLEQAIVCFKIKNLTANLLEGNIIVWLKKPSGLSPEIPFYLKIKSDSNKEQLVRILGKAFDKKENKEIYPWTLLVTKAYSEIEKKIREYKQDFSENETIPKDVVWMLEPFIQEDQINTFFGLGSSGKTILSMYFATQIAEEKGFNTMLIDYENDPSSWADKVIKIAGEERSREKYIYFDSEQIPLFEQVDKLKEVIKRRNIKLIIVDSASLASGDSTSDEKATLRLISGIKLLRTTTVLIAHQRKNDGDKNPIGSIQYENQARNVWNFKSETDNNVESTLHVACKHTKANNTYLRKQPIGFKIVFGLDTINITREDAGDYFEDKLPIHSRIEKLLSEDGSLPYKEIAQRLGISVKQTSKVLSLGKTSGFFTNDTEGKWSLGDALSTFRVDGLE